VRKLAAVAEYISRNSPIHRLNPLTKIITLSTEIVLPDNTARVVYLDQVDIATTVAGGTSLANHDIAAVRSLLYKPDGVIQRPEIFPFPIKVRTPILQTPDTAGTMPVVRPR
jgi:hypothetical protein